MSTNNIFSINTSDLGADISFTGTSKEDIDSTLRNDYEIDETVECYVCHHNPPIYKLIAKLPELNTAELERIGYICQACLHYADASKYGIRKLNKINTIGGLL